MLHQSSTAFGMKEGRDVYVIRIYDMYMYMYVYVYVHNMYILPMIYVKAAPIWYM